MVTNERLPKKELIRVVKNNAGEVFVDLTGKANGHGAYIKKSLEAIELAKNDTSPTPPVPLPNPGNSGR